MSDGSLFDLDPSAVPTAQPFVGRSLVVRADARAFESSTLAEDLVFMRRLGVRPLVVHSARTEALGRQLVGLINRIGGDAVDLDGTSASTLVTCVDEGARPVIRSVNAQLVALLLDSGYIPIFASLGAGVSGRPMQVPADDVARALAAATNAARLLLSEQHGGVPGDDAAIIDELTSSEALALAAAGTLDSALAERLTAAALSVRSGVGAAQILDLASGHAVLVELLTAQHVGTQVVSFGGP